MRRLWGVLPPLPPASCSTVVPKAFAAKPHHICLHGVSDYKYPLEKLHLYGIGLHSPATSRMHAHLACKHESAYAATRPTALPNASMHVHTRASQLPTGTCVNGPLSITPRAKSFVLPPARAPTSSSLHQYPLHLHLAAPLQSPAGTRKCFTQCQPTGPIAVYPTHALRRRRPESNSGVLYSVWHRVRRPGTGGPADVPRGAQPPAVHRRQHTAHLAANLAVSPLPAMQPCTD